MHRDFYLYSLSLLCLLAFCSLFAQSNGSIAGTYQDANLKLILNGQNSQLSGTVAFEGQQFQVNAQSSDGVRVDGYYVYFGQAVPFTGFLQNGQLTISSEGDTFVLKQLGQKPAAKPATSPSPAPTAAKPSAPGEVKNNDWGMSFMKPAGWDGRLTESGYVLGSNTQKGILLILPNEAKDMATMRAEAQKGLMEEGGTFLSLAGQLKTVGKNGLAGKYQGTLQGEQANAYVLGLISPHEYGAIVMVAVEPGSYGPAYEQLVEKLAKSIRFFKPVVPPVAEKWKRDLNNCKLSYYDSYSSYSGGGYTTKKTFDLCAAGFFRYNLEDETIWNAGDGSLTGGYAMNYGNGNGTWSVVGRGDQAVLVLKFYDGKVWEYEMSTNADGHTLMNGTRYLRTCNPNDSVVEARPDCF